MIQQPSFIMMISRPIFPISRKIQKMNCLRMILKILLLLIVSGNSPDDVTLENALSVKYTVRDTTFFHNQPDESSIRKSYLDPLHNNVLDPIRDKNGFIYIVYTNQFGRTSKGWINKKDLIQLR